MERTYIVYEHVSPDGKRYIGITSQKPQMRWRNGEGYSKNKHFYRAIQKYGWSMFSHNILFESMSEKAAKAKEKELIKKYETTSPKYGYNITRGGETRQPCPEYVKELIRAKNIGKTVSMETRLKISKAKKGKKKGPMSEEQKAKISKSLIGNKYALGKHNNTKRLAMCDDSGTIIKEFKSAIDAEKEIKCNASGINRACVENSKDCGLENTKYGGIYKGFKWFYLNENGEIINNNHGVKKNKRNGPIIQYDLQGNKICEFEKMKDAAKNNGLSINGLAFALKGKEEVEYKGFLWARKK